jgi:hypothetical protein
MNGAAAEVAIRDDAERLDPLSDDVAERRKLAGVLRPAPRHAS